MTKQKLIVGNWKMNFTVHESSLFVHKLAQLIKPHRDVQVVLAPSFLALQPLSLQIDRRQFRLAAQNFFWRDSGAYTGEVSAAQLRGLVDYALVGHSERRHVMNETDKDIRNKMQAAVRNGLLPILCVGETAAERADNETLGVLHDQLTGGLANLTSEEIMNVTIAYEPVWAIGTGNNARPEDAERAMQAIRRQVRHLYGDKTAESIKVLYGGSVTASSAADYLSVAGIDGLLVGGASLNAHEFGDIVKLAHLKTGGKTA